MRKKNREITEKSELEALVNKSDWGVLSMCDNGSPYAVPVNVAWDGARAYIHCAGAGHKLDVLRANPRVQLTLVPEAELVRGAHPCDCSTNYRSVSIEGRAEILSATGDPEKHLAAMECIARRFGFANPEFMPGILAKTTVICVEPINMTGKRNPAADGA